MAIDLGKVMGTALSTHQNSMAYAALDAARREIGRPSASTSYGFAKSAFSFAKKRQYRQVELIYWVKADLALVVFDRNVNSDPAQPLSWNHDAVAVSAVSNGPMGKVAVDEVYKPFRKNNLICATGGSTRKATPQFSGSLGGTRDAVKIDPLIDRRIGFGIDTVKIDPLIDRRNAFGRDAVKIDPLIDRRSGKDFVKIDPLIDR